MLDQPIIEMTEDADRDCLDAFNLDRYIRSADCHSFNDDSVFLGASFADDGTIVVRMDERRLDEKTRHGRPLSQVLADAHESARREVTRLAHPAPCPVLRFVVKPSSLKV